MMKFVVSILVFSAFFLGSTIDVFSQSQQNDNYRVASLIAKKRAYNRVNSFGYRIQLFNGDEHTAKQKRNEFRARFPYIRTYRKYNPPEWKIQIGHYKTTLEADRFLLKLKKQFPSAIVIPLTE